jgi:hypothetical protein
VRRSIRAGSRPSNLMWLRIRVRLKIRCSIIQELPKYESRESLAIEHCLSTYREVLARIEFERG